MPNALAHESSPYLRQHADNPVDWLPWGNEAFARARTEDRPILLSIGYAACHWCHVMAHESFEDPITAALMNRLFVNVKVDREERPDVDGIYMQAVQALTGQGGWPMTMFLTPDGRPFYGGTYYPPEDRHGMPSFRRVLERVDEAWRTQRDAVERGAAGLMRVFDRTMQGDGLLSGETLEAAVAAARARFDAVHGGFGGAPKFPPTMLLEFLLTQWSHTGDATLLAMVRHTWERMAGGGLHDQIGGGFHRYTVDGAWLVPHFEKMLYDNALLIRLGGRVWQATGDPSARLVTRRAAEWLSREMTADDGTWFASLDADSEGHEGKFYTWTVDELRSVLGPDADLLMAWWDATPTGNFEGVNIPWTPHDPEQFAADHGETRASLEAAIVRGRSALLAHRSRRVRPARDEKVLAGWNGLMLRAIAEVARCFDDAELRGMAVRAAEGLVARLIVDGRAARTVDARGRRLAGVLEDQAALALGFLAVHELTGEGRWIDQAMALSGTMAERFWDATGQVWYDTAADGEQLITRPHDPFDNAHPSGASLAVELEVRLHALDGAQDRLERIAPVLDGFAGAMASHPNAFGHLLSAADLAVHGVTTLVMSAGAGREALETAARGLFVPGLQVVDARSAVPVTGGRTDAGGVARAFVCRGFTCDLPVSTPAELARQLAAATRRPAS